MGGWAGGRAGGRGGAGRAGYLGKPRHTLDRGEARSVIRCGERITQRLHAAEWLGDALTALELKVLRT